MDKALQGRNKFIKFVPLLLLLEHSESFVLANTHSDLVSAHLNAVDYRKHLSRCCLSLDAQTKARLSSVITTRVYIVKATWKMNQSDFIRGRSLFGFGYDLKLTRSTALRWKEYRSLESFIGGHANIFVLSTRNANCPLSTVYDGIHAQCQV